MKIIYIMGKDGSGKQTVYDNLSKDTVIPFTQLDPEYDLLEMEPDTFESNGIYLVIGRLSKYLLLKNKFGDDLLPVYLYVDDQTRLIRNIYGYPDQLFDICKTFVADTYDYSEVKLTAAKLTRHVMFNNNGSISGTIHKIRSFILRNTKKERERN